ncbi:hypothetical protein SAMN05216199_1249 [Pedococcus cremeus]|uniref:Uncharacterized protein n=1 Tax=Pedococcus cremeus TaxID=587636 RepID=A0A1H9S506_9MICO|nr:hypothetical protein [Pedococcus cremeus]SER79695.1 hypothetical protein SAMN05216199_1249 [Pedococcus cremeus]
MRTALRTTVAVAAIVVPLTATALPATAASSLLYRDRGTYAETYFEGAGTPGGLPGNYSMGWLSFHSTDVAEGYVDTYACDPGETPWGDVNGENACDPAGSYYAWGETLKLVSGKGKNPSSTYSGTLGLYDMMSESGATAAEGVPFTVTLTPSGATSRTTFTDSLKDPESGYTYKYSETRTTSYAAVAGSLDGVPAVGGSVGTYSLRSMERSR